MKPLPIIVRVYSNSAFLSGGRILFPKETWKVFGKKMTVKQTIHKFLYACLTVQKHYFNTVSTLSTQSSNPWRAFPMLFQCSFYIRFPDFELKLGNDIIINQHGYLQYDYFKLFQ